MATGFPRDRHTLAASNTSSSHYKTMGVRRESLPSPQHAGQTAHSPLDTHAKQCVAEFPEDAWRTRAPAGEILFSGSAGVTYKQGYTTFPGNVHGATSNSMTCTTSGNLSFSSDGCGSLDRIEIHSCVSDGSTCAGNVCCQS